MKTTHPRKRLQGHDTPPFMEEKKMPRKRTVDSRLFRTWRLMSSQFLENGTIISPLLLFYLNFGLAATLQKNLSLCAIHSVEVLQQLCSVCSGCQKRGREESNSECCGSKNEVTSKQFLWLAEYGSKSIKSDKVSQWRKYIWNYQWQNIQAPWLNKRWIV